MLNPNVQDSPSIMIRYKEYSDKPVVFPKLDGVLELASKEMESVSSFSEITDHYDYVCDISYSIVTRLFPKHMKRTSKI